MADQHKPRQPAGQTTFPGNQIGPEPERGMFWLASYPKSGNTWFRIVLAAYLADAPVDLNAIATGTIASSRIWVDDVAGFDTSDLTQEEVMRLRPQVYRWSATQERRQKIQYHKIHDAWLRTPDGVPLIDLQATRGAVYLVRNPLDVAPSLAHHNGTDIDRAIAQMGDPEACLARKTSGLSEQLLQRMGTWSQHVTSWVDAPDLALHVIRYEDMLANAQAQFQSAFDFLALPPDPDRLARAINSGRFDVIAEQERKVGFRERPGKSRNFFRKGKAGDWRETLSAAQVTRLIADHATVMQRLGYLDLAGNPV